MTLYFRKHKQVIEFTCKEHYNKPIPVARNHLPPTFFPITTIIDILIITVFVMTIVIIGTGAK